MVYKWVTLRSWSCASCPNPSSHEHKRISSVFSAISKKAKLLGGAPDFQKPEGSVWEEFENARKAISHGRAAQLPECAP